MSLRERTRPELGIIEHEARGRRGLGALSREPDGIASSFFHRDFYFWGAAKELSGINQVYAVGLAAKHSLMCSVAKTKAPREARGAFHL